LFQQVVFIVTTGRKAVFVEYLKQYVELFSLTHISCTCILKTASLLG